MNISALAKLLLFVELFLSHVPDTGSVSMSPGFYVPQQNPLNMTQYSGLMFSESFLSFGQMFNICSHDASVMLKSIISNQPTNVILSFPDIDIGKLADRIIKPFKLHLKHPSPFFNFSI